MRFLQNGDMEFIAKIDQIHCCLQWIKAELRSMDFDPTILHRLELASEEALVNIINHAYQGRPEKVEIWVNLFPKSHAEIVFKDHGPPFNPLDAQSAQDLSLEERKIGGLGIHLMRKCVDEIQYSRIENHNVLVFIIRSSQKK